MEKFSDKNPHLVSEWHPTKNGNLRPSDVSAGSGKSIWWVCEKGHSYPETPCHRSQGRGCPYCAGRRATPGENDLATTHPEIASQWHPTENGDLTPQDFKAGSGKKVWWRCEQGHKYQATIKNRTSVKSGCPYCSNKKVLSGFNDLATTRPDLAKEWNYERNDPTLSPATLTYGSGKKVWWKCAQGHEWQATVNSRTQGNSCPECNEIGTSFPEQALFFYLERDLGLVVEHRATILGTGMEADIWIPHLETAIEYNGMYWHANKSSIDRTKERVFLKAGIRLISIWEDSAQSHNSLAENIVLSNLGKDALSTAIFDLESLLNISPKEDIDVERDETKILARYKKYETEHSFASVNPLAAAQWHPTKNGSLLPTQFKPHSNHFVWWKCEYGHEWEATFNDRMNGNGCPYCSGHRAILGENDLATTHPEIASQWHPTENGDLTPQDFKAGSGKEVWWKCDRGHKWKAAIKNRTIMKNGCPYCSNKKVLSGFNDLATIRPDIAKQWHPTKNKNLNPTDIVVGSNKKVWWKCEQGHTWEAAVSSRTRGSGCPFCTGRKVLEGFNDLVTTHPEVASLWHPTKNDISPTEITAGSNKRVYWKCEQGHEWQAIVAKQVARKNACLICKNEQNAEHRN